MQLKKYPKKFTTLFISTILLLASTPVVSASEEPSSEDEMSQVEELETLVDENEVEPEAATISIEADDINRDDAISENTDRQGNEETTEPEGAGEPEEPVDPEPIDPVPNPEPAPEPIDPVPNPEPAPEPEPEPEQGSDTDPDPNPDPDSDPEPIDPEPVEPDPESDDPEPPVVSEPLPDTSIEPILEPNPIEPNASTVSGIANPGAHVIVMYPGTDRQRAATVNTDGSWLIRNVGGDQAYLREGSRVPMNLLVMDNGQEYTYSYEFAVGDPAATDLIEDSQVAYVPNDTETASIQNNPSSTTESASTQEKEQELLPPTGEEDNLSILAFVSIASGMGLIFVDKIKRKHA